MECFRCNLCNQGFDINKHTPRMLTDCGHTFCEKCLLQRLSVGHIVCPEDDTQYSNRKDIHDFPINTTLVNILKNNYTPAEIRLSELKTQEDYNSQQSKYQSQEEVRFSSKFQQKIYQEDQPEKVPNYQSQNQQIRISLKKMKQAVKIGYAETQPEEQQSQISQNITKMKSAGKFGYSQDKNQKEEKLENLLTPSNFLNNILGNQASQQQSYRDQSQLNNHKNDKNQNWVVEMIEQHFTALQNQIGKKFNDISQQISQRKIKVCNEISQIKEQLINNLLQQVQTRRNIKQNENKYTIDQIELDLKAKISLIINKVQIEFQSQLEQLIQNFCIIKNLLQNDDTISREKNKNLKPSIQYFQQNPQTTLNNYNTKSFDYLPNTLENFTTFKKQEVSLFDTSNCFSQIDTQQNQSSYQDLYNNDKTISQNITSQQSKTPPKYRSPSPQKIFDKTAVQTPVIKIRKPLFLLKNQSSNNVLRIKKDEFDETIYQLQNDTFDSKYLDLKNKGIFYSDLVQNLGIDDRKLDVLTNLLCNKIHDVRQVKLSRNNITDKGFQIMIKNLISNKAITQINLKCNQISVNSLYFLKEVFKNGKQNSLSILFLKGNHINIRDHIKDITEIQNLGIVIYL